MSVDADILVLKIRYFSTISHDVGCGARGRAAFGNPTDAGSCAALAWTRAGRRRMQRASSARLLCAVTP
jgi:hypothetical protein